MNSDAKWYIDRTSGSVQEFYDVFFQICKKYHISWGSATEKEKAFVEEVARVTYELQLAKRRGISSDHVRPSFCA